MCFCDDFNAILLLRRNDGSIQDLVIWSAIDFFIPYMPNEFLEIRRKYWNRGSSRTRSLMEESHPCVHIVNSGLKFATASYFMKKTIDTKAREIVSSAAKSSLGNYWLFPIISGGWNSHEREELFPPIRERNPEILSGGTRVVRWSRPRF